MRPFSSCKLWHGLVLVYYLLLLALVGLLVSQERPVAEPVSLTEVVTSEARGRTRLAIAGQGFHPGLHGLLAESTVVAEARQWRFLRDVLLRNLAVAEGEDLALVSSYGSKLISLSLAAGRAPVVLGSLDMPASIEQVRIIGDQALVGLKGVAGLALVDLGDPKAMRLVAVFGPTVNFMDMVVDGQVVYLVDLLAGIGVLDLAAESPHVAIVDTLESVWRIALADQRLVVGTIKGEVRLYETLGSGQVKKVGNFSVPREVRDVALVGNTLAVATKSILHLYDVSAWPRLLPLSTIPLPGAAMRMLRVPERDQLVISLVAAGVCLVDVTQPALPMITGHLRLPQTYYDLVVSPETIYASGSSGFEAFSLEALAESRPTDDVQVTTDDALLNWNGQIFGLHNNDLTRLATGASQAGLRREPFLAVVEDDGRAVAYSRTADGALSQPQSLPTQSWRVTDALWQGDRLYLAHTAGLEVLLGSRPDQLLSAGGLDFAGSTVRLRPLDPDHLLVMIRNVGALIVDVTDPVRPVVRSQLPALKHLLGASVVFDALVTRGRAYVALGDAGVHVFDLSELDHPRLLQMIDTPGQAIGLALYDDLLLVADGMQGVFVIDIKDPNFALPVGSILAPVRVREIAVAADGVLINSQPGGLAKLPLPKRLSALQIVNRKEAVALVEGEVSRGQIHLYDTRGTAQIKVFGGK